MAQILYRAHQTQALPNAADIFPPAFYQGRFIGTQNSCDIVLALGEV
jgi:hypothetical protein